MLERGWLLAVGLMVIAASALGWMFFTPRAWQIGGLGFMPTPSYIGMALGLVMAVSSLPRRARAGVSLALVIGVSLFLVLWPSWEGRTLPNRIYIDELASVMDAERNPHLSVCVYTIDGSLWATPGQVGELPIERRITGFYASHLPLRARINLMSRGFRLRPVWPGSVRA